MTPDFSGNLQVEGRWGEISLLQEEEKQGEEEEEEEEVEQQEEEEKEEQVRGNLCAEETSFPSNTWTDTGFNQAVISTLTSNEK